MPKLKPTDLSIAEKTVQSNIEARGRYFGCRYDSDFAKKLSMAQSTYAAHRRDPRKWTLEQLVKVSIAFKVSLNWLMTDHSKDVLEEQNQ
ncbi:MAG: helix-turn-helix domain-containing protein [Eubacterium sp.]|nr:helix-turn-helix domain-containing protein [Eubacterium sp.]